MGKARVAGLVVVTGPACGLLILLLGLASCGAGPAPGTQAGLPAAPAAPRATWPPTWTPTALPTAAATATWVPLPSPAPGGGRGSVARLDADEARDLVALGEAVLVDVRSRALHAALHAAGAVSMPLDELEDRYERLPPDVTLIFYCA